MADAIEEVAPSTAAYPLSWKASRDDLSIDDFLKAYPPTKQVCLAQRSRRPVSIRLMKEPLPLSPTASDFRMDWKSKHPGYGCISRELSQSTTKSPLMACPKKAERSSTRTRQKCCASKMTQRSQCDPAKRTPTLKRYSARGRRWR